LATETAGLLEAGGELVDPRHDAPLFGQRGQGEFVCQEGTGLNALPPVAYAARRLGDAPPNVRLPKIAGDELRYHSVKVAVK
jgi:hypothetical protein